MGGTTRKKKLGKRFLDKLFNKQKDYGILREVKEKELGTLQDILYLEEFSKKDETTYQ